MAQTAVEWFVHQIGPFLEMDKVDAIKVIEQAKEMEKEQLEQAYMHGLAWMMPEGSERVTIVKSKWDI